MINHALSKGLLFLCSGCVLHGSGTVTLRFLGGLQKRMPVVGWCFVLGSAAIAALPPLNGFAGEFFLYLAMVFGGTSFAGGASPESSLILWVCLFILAAVGGFTLLCFVRLYGMAFLGSPRTETAETAHAPTGNETAAICIMAAFCIFSAVAAPKVAQLGSMAVTRSFHTVPDAAPVLTAAPARTLSSFTNLKLIPDGFIPPYLAPGSGRSGDSRYAIVLLREVNAIFLVFIAAVLAAFLLRRRVLRGRDIGSSPTWDCGYRAPTARIQYTAGSFSQPAAFFMRTILRQKVAFPAITEYFPLKARLGVITPDWIEARGFAPLFSLISRVADKCKELQHGKSNGYILYILITLVALLAWKLE